MFAILNQELARVFMKDNFASAPGLVNIYMTYIRKTAWFDFNQISADHIEGWY